MAPKRTIAILPFAFPDPREDHEGVLAVQGIAAMVENRLRLLPRTRVYVQHLLLSPEEGQSGPHFVVRSSMWPLHEALELPAPDDAMPTHILQGSLCFGEQIDAALELIDVPAAYVSFRRDLSAEPNQFLEQFFHALGELAAHLDPRLPAERRMILCAQPTASFTAFRQYIIGVGRRIQRQMGSEFPQRLLFEPFQKALAEDSNFKECCVALDVLAQEALSQRPKDEFALDVLREASRTAPYYNGFQRTLGVCLFDQGRYEEARYYLEQYIESSSETPPSGAAAYVRLAAIYHQSEGLTKAKQLLIDAMHRFPDNPDIRESLGVCLAESGNWKEAEACWRKVLEEHPSRTSSLSNLAVICWKNKDYDRARILFDRSIESPDATEASFTRYVEFLFEREDLIRADEVATERVERYPDKWRYWIQLAHIRRKLGQFSAAEHCLEQAQARDTTHEGAEEIEIARFALQHPADFPIYIAAIHTTTWTEANQPRDEQERVANLSSAINLLRGLTDRHPNYPFLWKLLVNRLEQLQQFESAAAAQQQYLKLVPNSAHGYNQLAGYLLRLNRKEEAIAAFRRAIEESPDPSVYRTNLATILVEEGRLADAEAELDAVEREKQRDFITTMLREKIQHLRREAPKRPASSKYRRYRQLADWVKSVLRF